MKQQLLMIEDDADDRYITEKYFSDNGVDIGLDFFDAAEDVVEYLSTLPDHLLPRLIILSPGKNRLQALQDLKSHPQFKLIPVVVLSETAHPSVVYEAYRLGASSVIQKPATHQDTQLKISTFAKYWFSTVELP